MPRYHATCTGPVQYTAEEEAARDAEEAAATGPAARCSSRCAECDALYKTKLSPGFLYSGFTYQINDDAQNSIAKREAYAHLSFQDAVTYPWDGVYARGWWDTSNVYHAMTAAQFLAFAKAVSDYVSVRTACCRDHKNALIAIRDDGVKTDAQKVIDINAYNIQTGW